MKILHTSDWHLGHTLYNYDRTEEQHAMIEQMVQIVREQQPDLFLLSGDIYHTSQPSSTVQTMFTEALVSIHQANPSMTIVVTAGNHDSATKHEIFRTPWLALNVHAIGALDREHPEEHIITIPGVGIVIAVPYCNERNIPQGYMAQLVEKATAQNPDNLPIIMMAHTSLKGCDYAGHDNASDHVIGGIDCLDVSEFGEGYDYLALGHIHHEQFVHTGHHNVRYCGSPLAVSFDEQYAHSVSLVEIAAHGDKPTVQKIEIANPRPLVTLPSEGAVSWDEAKKLLEAFPADIPAYIRLNVEVKDYLPNGATDEALTLTNGKQCRFCHINAIRQKNNAMGDKILTVQEFQTKNPLDIAHSYAKDMNIAFDDLEELFAIAMNSVKEEEEENL